MGILYKDGMLTKLGPAMDLMVYNQHHCWVLLSSLCLTAANTINTATDTRGKLGTREGVLGGWNFEEALIGNVHTCNPSPLVLEETYTAQACRIVFECLRLLAFCLRAALTAKLEEGETVFSRHALHSGSMISAPPVKCSLSKCYTLHP